MGRILTTLSLAGLVTGLAAVPAAAQQAAGKVAFINSRLVLAAAPGYAKAESLYTGEVAGFRLEVQKMQASLDSVKIAMTPELHAEISALSRTPAPATDRLEEIRPKPRP